jgi:hypothetical protein
MHRFAARVFIALFLVVSIAGFASSARAVTDRVLLVSWDGVGRDVVEELLHWQPLGDDPVACPAKRRPATMPVQCGEELTCLPNLCRFQFLNSWDSEGKPLTRPQHAQMLSGYGPVTTGVDRNAGSSTMPPGYTVYERLDAFFGPGHMNGHIAGRKYVSRGIVRWADQDETLDVNLRRGGPDGRTGVNTTKRALPVIADFADDRFFLFVHYKEADVTGHRAGTRKANYRETVISIDQQLGALMQGLEDAGIRDSTQVLVTTDHGFDGRFHVGRHGSIVETWIAADPWVLVDNGYAKLLDVSPTIYDLFGVPTDEFVPPLEGVSLLAPAEQSDGAVMAGPKRVAAASLRPKPVNETYFSRFVSALYDDR